MQHVLIVPQLRAESVIEPDPEIVRLDKLRKYYTHFNVFIRYKISFREFVAKVDSGTWNPYLA